MSEWPRAMLLQLYPSIPDFHKNYLPHFICIEKHMWDTKDILDIYIRFKHGNVKIKYTLNKEVILLGSQLSWLLVFGNKASK